MSDDVDTNGAAGKQLEGETGRPRSKRRDYMVRLAEHHAVKVEARARRAKLPPAAYMRDRIINIIDGTDPQEYVDAAREMREAVQSLAVAVRELSQEVRQYARPVQDLLSRIRMRVVDPER